MITTTEKYIKKAVEEAKQELSGHSISNCNFTLNIEAVEATQILAEAMLEQAKANLSNSEAMDSLASALKPIEVCSVKISKDIEVGGK